MAVYWTGGGVLRVVGVKLTNGDGGSYYSGGGKYIKGGTVQLVMCVIENNKAYASDMLVRTAH